MTPRRCPGTPGRGALAAAAAAAAPSAAAATTRPARRALMRPSCAVFCSSSPLTHRHPHLKKPQRKKSQFVAKKKRFVAKKNLREY